MKYELSNRGFGFIMHTTYHANTPEDTRLISESSAVGDYEDSFERPGSSYLWVGDNHHLNREEVEELVIRMQGWLLTGRIPSGEEEAQCPSKS